VRLQAGGGEGKWNNTNTLGECVDDFGHTCHIVGGRGSRGKYGKDEKETRGGCVDSEMDLYCTQQCSGTIYSVDIPEIRNVTDIFQYFG